jgi:hypothetical protein
MQTDEELLAEIFEIYKPPVQRPHPGYRAYYDAGTSEIICFSQEELEHPYVQVEREIYESFRPDLFKIVDGKIMRIEQYQTNRLQLKKNGSIFASMKDNMQFAVPLDWMGEKTYWDMNV